VGLNQCSVRSSDEAIFLNFTHASSPDTAHPLSVTIVGREALPELRAEWNDLCQRMEYATPFASWEWADGWLQVMGRDSSVLIAVARRNGRAVGILPLARHGSGAWLPALTVLGVDRLYPDHIALLAEGEVSKDLLATLLRAALAAAGRRARIDLPMVAADSGMDRACAEAGLPARVRAAGIAPYLPITGSFDKFLAGLSSNERYKIRNRTKKMLAVPGVRFGGVAEGDLPVVLGRLRELHALRSTQKGIESSFDRDDVQQFHARLVAALPAESLTFRCLYSGEEIFAVFYGFTLQGRLFYFQLGYDPAWSDRSPGIVLLSEVIREAHERGCIEFNFLQGDEPFKWTWTKQSRTLNNWTFYSPGAVGRLRRKWEAGFDRFKASIKGLLFRVPRPKFLRVPRPKSARADVAQPADRVPPETNQPKT
jgi:CelD/BcsL family acetyltransferase involved in cellulose biosynthesis